ncbi:MFS-type transporter SLC18B1-like isoform X4 [Dendrobates tinctorius]|uniref:MFS-type transporter SLC18B1-like isoform X4 n=1 Tax=Dendrobates tinctorius TaxID=92724 RepID=UPI003CC9348E
MSESTDVMPENNTNNSRKLSRNQVLTLISTASLNFSSMICYSVLGPFFPQEATKKGVSNTVIGLIFGCFALFNFLSSLILGKYIVQIGAKFMFVAGLSLSGVATILFGFLDKASEGTVFIALCFLVRSVDAVGFGASITSSFAILAKAFPNNIATVMGSLEVFSGLGLVLGPPIGGVLYQSFGYEVPFIALGCLVLLMVPLNLFVLPRYDSFPGKDSFWSLVKLPKVMLMCFMIFSLSSCLGFLDPTMSLFLTETFDLKVGYVGLVFLGLAVFYAISSPLLGVLSDRLPKLRKWLLIVGNLGTALCFFMLGPAPIFHIDRSFVGPTLGGFLNEKFNFQSAAAFQGLLPLLAFVLSVIFYTWEAHNIRRFASVHVKNMPTAVNICFSFYCEENKLDKIIENFSLHNYSKVSTW